MNLLRLLNLAASLYAGYQYWGQRTRVDAAVPASGFIATLSEVVAQYRAAGR